MSSPLGKTELWRAVGEAAGSRAHPEELHLPSFSTVLRLLVPTNNTVLDTVAPNLCLLPPDGN